VLKVLRLKASCFINRYTFIYFSHIIINIGVATKTFREFYNKLTLLFFPCALLYGSGGSGELAYQE